MDKSISDAMPTSSPKVISSKGDACFSKSDQNFMVGDHLCFQVDNRLEMDSEFLMRDDPFQIANFLEFS